MKILVTGAGGFLGTGVCECLIGMGHQVVAASNRSDGLNESIEVIAGDIFEPADPFTYYGEPDALLHLAWKDGFVHNSSAHLALLYKHIAFIERFAQSGCKQISVLGSMHEIGFHEGCIHADTPAHPLSMYGIAKNALKEACYILSEQYNFSLRWLRGYYIVKNDSRGNSIFSKIYQAEKEGQTLFPFTSGKNQYDFLDYDEFCHKVALAATQDKINGTIEICSGHPERLADRVERFIAENNFSIRLDYGAYPDRPYDSKAVWGDSRLIDLIVSNSTVL